MAQVNAGRVRFVSKGEYNNETQYYIFDLVNYNGSSYYAKENTIGILPTNTTKWQLVAEKGNIGPVGPQGETGNGIVSVTKTSTSGLIDTYTITYTNGNTSTFNITNGEDGEVTQEQLDQVIKDLEYWKTTNNALPKVEGEGTEIALDNTADSPLSLGLKTSESTQDSEPTPENPQNIHVIKGDNEIIIKSKNLTYISSIYASSYTATLKNNKILINGTSNSSGNIQSILNGSDGILLKANKTYTVSVIVSGEISGTGYKAIYMQTNNSTISIGQLNSNRVSQYTITPSEDVTSHWINFDLAGNLTFTNVIVQIQIEENNAATSYVEHKEQSYPINLEDLEMCKISTYADEFFKNVPECEYYDSTLQEGKWYKYARIGRIILDGSENWDATQAATDYYRYIATIGTYQSTTVATVIGINNYFVQRTTQAHGAYEYLYLQKTSGSALLCYIQSQKFATTSELTDWLSSHNVSIYYILDTPTKTLLPDTLQTQLDNILYAMAYQDQTNISQINEDRPFVISASTIKDMKTLEDRITALEESISL